MTNKQTATMTAILGAMIIGLSLLTSGCSKSPDEGNQAQKPTFSTTTRQMRIEQAPKVMVKSPQTKPKPVEHSVSQANPLPSKRAPQKGRPVKVDTASLEMLESLADSWDLKPQDLEVVGSDVESLETSTNLGS